jgi:hypothetical protein
MISSLKGSVSLYIFGVLAKGIPDTRVGAPDREDGFRLSVIIIYPAVIETNTAYKLVIEHDLSVKATVLACTTILRFCSIIDTSTYRFGDSKVQGCPFDFCQVSVGN